MGRINIGIKKSKCVTIRLSIWNTLSPLDFRKMKYSKNSKTKVNMEFICQKAGRLDAIMSEALNVPRNQIEKADKTRWCWCWWCENIKKQTLNF